MQSVVRVLVKYLEQPSIRSEPEVLVIEPLDWRSLIISYLRDGAPPSTDTESTKLRFKASKYILIDDVQCEKSFFLPYLRCLAQDEAEYALRKIHERIFGQHLRADHWLTRHLGKVSIGQP